MKYNAKQVISGDDWLQLNEEDQKDEDTERGYQAKCEQLVNENNLLMLQLKQLIILLRHKDEELDKKDDMIKRQKDKVKEQSDKLKLSRKINEFASNNEKLLIFGNNVISEYCMKENRRRQISKQMGMNGYPLQIEPYFDVYEDDGKEKE